MHACIHAGSSVQHPLLLSSNTLIHSYCYYYLGWNFFSISTKTTQNNSTIIIIITKNNNSINNINNQSVFVKKCYRTRVTLSPEGTPPRPSSPPPPPSPNTTPRHHHHQTFSDIDVSSPSSVVVTKC